MSSIPLTMGVEEEGPLGGFSGSTRFAPRAPTGLGPSGDDPGRSDLKRFSGHFLIFRKRPKGLRKTVGGRRLPFFRHPTFEAAETEARRLHALHPDSTFVIMQEVARIKRPAPTEGDE